MLLRLVRRHGIHQVRTPTYLEKRVSRRCTLLRVSSASRFMSAAEFGSCHRLKADIANPEAAGSFAPHTKH